MKLNNKLLKINHSEILNKPITYVSWGNSITFDIPRGRQAIVLDGNYGFLFLWNPADKVNSAVIYGNNTYNVSRASNNTTITISRGSNTTWTAFVFI